MLQISYIRYSYRMNTKQSKKAVLDFISAIPPYNITTWCEDIDNDYSETIVRFNARNQENAEKFVSLLKAHFEG